MPDDIIKMDCGCEVEISMVRISADDPTEYRGGKITKFCEEHKLPFNQQSMLREAFKKYDNMKLESTDKGKFIIRRCPFSECKNRDNCLKTGYVCPAMCMINKRQELV